MTSSGCRTFLALATALTILGTVSGSPRGHALAKRSADANVIEYPDYEYQRVMPKRAALLLDRLLVALQKAVENDDVGKENSNSYVRSLPNFSDMPDSQRMQLSNEKTMDLQRRGQAKGRVYWRCYFNAVTCFKRK
ncbi:uncharacterized protein LOC100680495 [Nasonia vitripennis]|uniref:Allatostatin CC preprohormone n=1 Tax=Nasonia vitripennis TaxID=7425 RepID=G3C801_NASVI|nr:uncharacterized protein LOC100680495 [Nasonia vitripennis]ADM15719.1 allatostatin CC preprohormone [Nasonia vitripennis]